MNTLAFGEVLWDIYPTSKHLGGATLNFAAHFSKCGGDSWILSAVGRDELGEKALEEIKRLRINTEILSFSESKETGKCLVSLNKDKLPSYNLLNHVAYDEIIKPDLSDKTFDVLYFGTLALRNKNNYCVLNQIIKENKFNDTISERKEMFFRTKRGDVRLDTASYKEYLLDNYGLVVESDKEPIINKVSEYKGELYTAISNDYLGYPILCKIKDNVLVPFAVCPGPMTYEFRYFINDDGVFGMYRFPPDDHETGRAAYTISKDGGKTWSTTIFDDGVQSRPDIIEYYGKPLIIYNYKSDKSIENFPPMHNNRNAIKIIYDGKVVFDWFTKYGVVEYDFVNICGDIYMSFSNCPQALSTENTGAWSENGRKVEQGKETIQWAKIGYLLNDK